MPFVGGTLQSKTATNQSAQLAYSRKKRDKGRVHSPVARLEMFPSERALIVQSYKLVLRSDGLDIFVSEDASGRCFPGGSEDESERLEQ